jgi:hypothetical protein
VALVTLLSPASARAEDTVGPDFASERRDADLPAQWEGRRWSGDSWIDISDA